MLNSNLKGAFRWLIRDGLATWVNLGGLTLALTSCLVIWSYVRYETTYDRYHVQHENIYRIETRTTANGQTSHSASCPLRYAPTLLRDFPEVIAATRLLKTVKRSLSFEDKYFMEDGVYYADRSVFDIFSFRMLEGDAATALELPFTMVLTESLARKYFGDETALGNVITWDGSNQYIVTGVVEDPPENSHFSFSVLASFSTFFSYDPNLENLWLEWNVPTYLLLTTGTDHEEFEAKLSDFSEKYLKEALEARGVRIEHSIRPLEKLHLAPAIAGGLGEPRDAKSVYSLVLVMVLIVLIAGFNFVNLSAARSCTRSREVCIRKACGADRIALLKRFMAEPVLLAIASFVLALIAALLAENSFSNLGRVPIKILDARVLWVAAVLALLTGFAAGIFGAFRIILPPLRGRKLIRSVPVVLQVSISILLLAFSLVVNSQYNYLRKKDPGFEKNQLIVLLQNQDVRNSLTSLMDEIRKIEGVASAASSSMVPGEIYLFTSGTYPEDHSREQMFSMENFRVDPEFLASYGIETIAGRGFFPGESAGDEDALIINQTAAAQLGWEDPVGKWIEMNSASPGMEPELKRFRIIGVYKDFHHRNLYAPIEPAFIRLSSNEGVIENRARRLSVALKEKASIDSLVSSLHSEWKEFYGETPFYYFHLAESYDALHQEEKRLGRIFIIFTSLAIGITCMGLFALAYFISGRRIRELAIRKVHGADTGTVLLLLNRQFFWIILLANLIGWPLAFWASHAWLKDFAYTEGMDPLLPLVMVPGSLILFLALVSIRSYRAASSNPAEVLKYE